MRKVVGSSLVPFSLLYLPFPSSLFSLKLLMFKHKLNFFGPLFCFCNKLTHPLVAKDQKGHMPSVALAMDQSYQVSVQTSKKESNSRKKIPVCMVPANNLLINGDSHFTGALVTISDTINTSLKHSG